MRIELFVATERRMAELERDRLRSMIAAGWFLLAVVLALGSQEWWAQIIAATFGLGFLTYSLVKFGRLDEELVELHHRRMRGFALVNIAHLRASLEEHGFVLHETDGSDTPPPATVVH